MPADIDPDVSNIGSVQYYSIDDLKEINEQNVMARKAEIESA